MPEPMTAVRKLRAAKRCREDRGATDPILVIAAIAVSLVLLVGGGFAVQGLITNGQDSNAKGDLDKAAVAQESVVTAVEKVYIYDNHRDSVYRALEQPPVKGGAIGFEPTAGGRLIVDANIGADGDKHWIAVSHSRSGSAFMRTSESNAIYPVGTAQVYAAGPSSMPLEVVTVPQGAKFPAGFDTTDVEAMMAAFDGDYPYFDFADRGEAPGHGEPAQPGDNGAGGGSGGDAGGDTGEPIVWSGPIPDGGLTGSRPTPIAGVQDNGTLGYDMLGQPYGVQMTEADLWEGSFYVQWDKGYGVRLPIDVDAQPFRSGVPVFQNQYAGFTSAEFPLYDTPVTEVRAFLGGKRITVEGTDWNFSPIMGEGYSGFSLDGENVTFGAPTEDFLNAGIIQVQLGGSSWQTFNLENLADFNVMSGDRGRTDVSFATTQQAQVTMLDTLSPSTGFRIRLRGPVMPQMTTLPGAGTYSLQGLWVEMSDGRIVSATGGTARPTLTISEQNMSSCWCDAISAEATRFDMRMPSTTFFIPADYNRNTYDPLTLRKLLDGAKVTMLIGGVEYTAVIHRGAARGATV